MSVTAQVQEVHLQAKQRTWLPKALMIGKINQSEGILEDEKLQEVSWRRWHMCEIIWAPRSWRVVRGDMILPGLEM